MIVIVTPVMAVTRTVAVHNMPLHDNLTLTDLLSPQEAAVHQDWNGHNSDSGLTSLDPCLEADTEAGSEPSNCDLKETSSGDNGSSGDPVAKAIEQRSYR